MSENQGNPGQNTIDLSLPDNTITAFSTHMVKETPPRLGASSGASTLARGSGEQQSPETPAFGSASMFRLQPRGGAAVATPSPSLGPSASRGRKRNAQCLGASPALAAIPKDMFKKSPGGEVAFFQPRTCTKSFALSPLSGDAEWCLSPSVAMGRNPSRVESAMKSLSIKSPQILRGLDMLSTSPMPPHRTPVRAPGSSFSAYSPSPLGSSLHRNATGESIPLPSVGSVAKASSASPAATKFAPLKLIHKDGKDLEKTPTRRPPLHMGPSSMLLSIDSGKRIERGIQDEKMMDAPVAFPPSSITIKSSPSSGSQNDAFGDSVQMHPETPQPKPAAASVRAVRGGFFGLSPSALRSPAATMGSRTPGTTYSSPHTPLPSTKLTPRSTPRCHGSESPLSDLGLLRCDLNFTPSRGGKNEMSVSPVARKPPARSSTTALRSEAGQQFFEAKKSSGVPPKESSYLPVPNWYDKPSPSKRMWESPQFPPIIGSIVGPQDREKEDNRSARTPEVKTRSLLAPSQNSEMMLAMANEFAPSLDDDSLTDDEEPFLLCDPAALVEERTTRSRSRQRPRLSYGDKAEVRQSYASFSSYAQASSTSLSGMNFLQGDSTASLPQREFTSPSGNKRRATQNSADVLVDGCNDSGNNAPPARLRSVGSFGSIGLPLDGPAGNNREPDRDLITPPPILARASASPPRDHHPIGTQGMISSICIARSDPASVNFAISKMEFQSYQHRSPGMECSF